MKGRLDNVGKGGSMATFGVRKGGSVIGMGETSK
jgi:hypothetical protein